MNRSESSKKIFLHAGMGKVGSTSIQNTLLANKAEFLSQGISVHAIPQEYPEQEALMNACYREHQFKVEESVAGKIKVGQADQGWQEDLIKTIRSDLREGLDKADCLVASNEYCFDMHPGRCEERLRLLKEIFGPLTESAELTLVVYIRRPDALIESLYYQWFKPDFAVPFSDFLAHFQPFSQRGYLDFGASLRQLSGAFPGSKMIVRPIELLKERGTGLVDDLIEIIGGNSDSLVRNNDKDHTGLSRVGIEIIKSISHSEEFNNDFARKLMNSGVFRKQVGDEYRFFAPQDRKAFTQHYTQSLQGLLTDEEFDSLKQLYNAQTVAEFDQKEVIEWLQDELAAKGVAVEGQEENALIKAFIEHSGIAKKPQKSALSRGFRKFKALFKSP